MIRLVANLLAHGFVIGFFAGVAFVVARFALGFGR